MLLMGGISASSSSSSGCYRLPTGCSYTTVQAGINAAAFGDHVVVGTPSRAVAETSVENIQMKEGMDTFIDYNDPFAY